VHVQVNKTWDDVPALDCVPARLRIVRDFDNDAVAASQSRVGQGPVRQDQFTAQYQIASPKIATLFRHENRPDALISKVRV
jgi:hypothetical protein